MAVPPPARSSGREPDPPGRPASPPEGAPEAGRPSGERPPQPHRPAAEQEAGPSQSAAEQEAGPSQSAAEQEAGPSQSAAEQAPQPPRSGDRAVESTASSAEAQVPVVRIWPAVQARPTAQVRPAVQVQPAAEIQPAARTRPAVPTRPAVQVRPMVHVEDMAASIAFYRRLGAEVVHGGPDSDWALVQLGATQLDLIARPPRVERGECTVELNLAVTAPLDELRDMLRRSGDPGADFEVHPDLGEHLEVRTADGLLIKISQLNPDL